MIKLHKRIFEEFNKQYMMMIPLSIIVQSCFGSIVALYLLQGQGNFFILKLALVTILCMGYNASILAQLRVQISYRWLVASLGLNLVILLSTF